MAIPVAYFGYSKNGLQVTFQNMSLNSPTSYAWDFGDGNSDTVKNPVHTYTVEGFFTVSLIATNADGSSAALIITVGASSSVTDSLNASIFELVDQYLPSALVGEASGTEKTSLIMRWQLYLQPLVYTPTLIAVADTHNEFRWPGLINFLIAQLSAYDIILQGANQFLSASGQLGGSSSTSNTGQNTPGNQQIKQIETGPARVEFFEDKNSSDSSETVSNVGDAFSSALKAGGALEQLKESICQLSKRVRIFLPMCGPLGGNLILPNVHEAPKPTANASNPFGVTERMI